MEGRPIWLVQVFHLNLNDTKYSNNRNIDIFTIDNRQYASI